MTPFAADIARYRNELPHREVSVFALVLRRAGLQVLGAYRLGQWLRRNHHPALRAGLTPLRWVVQVPLNELLGRAYGVTLAATADIGGGLYIGHGGGIDLRHCSLGAHCSIAQQTKIGPLPGESRGPRIGNRVWIGAHAHVLGPVVVGDGATIAAGAHVGQDVPPRTLVAGNPARVVRWGYDNSVILGGPRDHDASMAMVAMTDCEPRLG
jgi:serine O-acetyltransferase